MCLKINGCFPPWQHQHPCHISAELAMRMWFFGGGRVIIHLTSPGWKTFRPLGVVVLHSGIFLRQRKVSTFPLLHFLSQIFSISLSFIFLSIYLQVEASLVSLSVITVIELWCIVHNPIGHCVVHSQMFCATVCVLYSIVYYIYNIIYVWCLYVFLFTQHTSWEWSL